MLSVFAAHIIIIIIIMCLCSDSGDGGGTTSGCDSQRSSASYEEGTYDGRQGSVTYTCRDDEQMMKSSAAAADAEAVMYDQRYHQPYVVTVY